MEILISNDDGIHAEGLWSLVRELSRIAPVTVVAPDRERSAIGTAVSLHNPLRTKKIKTELPGVKAYSVDGTPSDSVILALGNLVTDREVIVVSGINNGLNLGEDVYISGTVGAALQGYFRDCPSLAVSAPYENVPAREAAARLAATLVSKMTATPLPPKFLLNLNLPDRPPEAIAGVKTAALARESHINTVEEASHRGQKIYWLLRERQDGPADHGTDIDAIEQGYVTVTPLYFHHRDRPPQSLLDDLIGGLIEDMIIPVDNPARRLP